MNHDNKKTDKSVVSNETTSASETIQREIYSANEKSNDIKTEMIVEPEYDTTQNEKEIDYAIDPDSDSFDEAAVLQNFSEKCPICSHQFNTVGKQKKKILAQCPACYTIFIRHAFLTKTVVENKDLDELNNANEIDMANISNEYIQEPAVTEKYIPKPPDERQIMQLKRLNIKGLPSTNEDASYLIKTIMDIIEFHIAQFYPSVSLLPTKHKFEIIYNVAVSPIFPAIYFEDEHAYNELNEEEDITAESFIDIINSVVKIDEIKKMLKTFINPEIFKSATEYIINFAKYVYNLEISSETANCLTFKAYAAGYGEKVKIFKNTIYDHSGLQHSGTSAMLEGNLRQFYNRKTAVYYHLKKLFEDNGYELQEKEEPVNRAYKGFIIIFAIFALFGLLTLLKGNF